MVLDDTDRFYKHLPSLPLISELWAFVEHRSLSLIFLVVRMIKASVLLVLLVARCCIGFRPFGMPKLYSRQPQKPLSIGSKFGTLSTSLGLSGNVERDDLRNVAIIGKLFQVHQVQWMRLIWYIVTFHSTRWSRENYTRGFNDSSIWCISR